MMDLESRLRKVELEQIYNRNVLFDLTNRLENVEKNFQAFCSTSYGCNRATWAMPSSSFSLPVSTQSKVPMRSNYMSAINASSSSLLTHQQYAEITQRLISLEGRIRQQLAGGQNLPRNESNVPVPENPMTFPQFNFPNNDQQANYRVKNSTQASGADGHFPHINVAFNFARHPSLVSANANDINNNKITDLPSTTQTIEKSNDQNLVKPCTSSPEMQEYLKDVRGILNKLNHSNFDKLSDDFLQVLRGQQDFVGIVEFVFKKSISEEASPTSPETYAKLLSMPKLSRNDRTKQSLMDIVRKISSNHFSELFDDQLELEESSKRRHRGILRFIGALFNVGLIPSSDIKNFMECLLLNPQENNLNHLCQLLKLTGRTLDTAASVHEAANQVSNSVWIKELIFQLEKVKDSSCLSNKTNFAIMDIKELHQSSWKPKPLKKVELQKKSTISLTEAVTSWRDVCNKFSNNQENKAMSIKPTSTVTAEPLLLNNTVSANSSSLPQRANFQFPKLTAKALPQPLLTMPCFQKLSQISTSSTIGIGVPGQSNTQSQKKRNKKKKQGTNVSKK